MNQSENPNLIGDYTRNYTLPLESGKHDDLKSILPETVVDLLEGKYAESVDVYKIIDCRYPYEYNGKES